MELFLGFVIILTSSFFLALTYGRNIMKGSKSILPAVLNGNKLVRAAMYIILIVGFYRLSNGFIDILT